MVKLTTLTFAAQRPVRCGSVLRRYLFALRLYIIFENKPFENSRLRPNCVTAASSVSSHYRDLGAFLSTLLR